MSTPVVNEVELCSNEDQQSSTMNEPNNSSLATDKDFTQLPSPILPIPGPNFLNSPQNTFFKNLSIPVPDILPHCTKQIAPDHSIDMPQDSASIPIPQIPAQPSNQNVAQNGSVFTCPNTYITVPKDLSKQPSLVIEESKSRLAIRFLLKKSKRLCGAIRFYLSKPDSVTANSNKFKNLMFSLKDSVKSTLSSGVPSKETISQITSSLVSNLKVQRLPDCLRFLGVSLMSINKHGKMSKIHEKSNLIQKPPSETFVNWMNKPDPEQEGEGHHFAKPKVYDCSYCDTKFFKLPLYLKHIRRHAKIIRCVNCEKIFSSVINKRRHQIQCHKKAIL